MQQSFEDFKAKVLTGLVPLVTGLMEIVNTYLVPYLEATGEVLANIYKGVRDILVWKPA